MAKDPDADGHFYYSVQTTGIYCLPSCSSRLPLRKNVRFHDSPLLAEKAGFRPCKRCSPNGVSRDQEQAAAIARACRAINAAETALTLAGLARRAGMSRFHFHRVFKKIVGITPKAYAVARRAERVRDELPIRRNVTDAIYRAGFNSSGRFYANAAETLGMMPTHFRKGGSGTSIRFAIGSVRARHCARGSNRKGRMRNSPRRRSGDAVARVAKPVSESGIDRCGQAVRSRWSQRSWPASMRPDPGSICRSTFAAQLFSKKSGRR